MRMSLFLFGGLLGGFTPKTGVVLDVCTQVFEYWYAPKAYIPVVFDLGH